ncbi:MAG: SDR family NAD(P)-dependent oxidoreductase [Microbacteriaceae bacterium]
MAVSSELADRVVVVFGASGGLGAGVSRRCAESGARLALVDIDAVALSSVCEELRSASAVDVFTCTADVAKPDDVDRAVAAVRAEFGRIDLAVNTVGVTNVGVSWELSQQDWQWVLAVNLWGAININRAVVPHMVTSGAGHVVHTSSTTALAPGRPGVGPYSVSKHGLVALCEGLQQDLRAHGADVKVSVFIPGTTRSSIASSERHRQPKFGAPSSRPADIAAMQAHLDTNGIDGYDAAADLLAGVTEGRFYIFARNVDRSIVAARADAILGGFLPPS